MTQILSPGNGRKETSATGRLEYQHSYSLPLTPKSGDLVSSLSISVNHNNFWNYEWWLNLLHFINSISGVYQSSCSDLAELDLDEKHEAM